MGRSSGRALEIALVAAVLVSAAMAADRDFGLVARPVFSGIPSSEGFTPVEVTIENRGPHTAGVLTVAGQKVSIAYPVELPQGTRKRFIAYVPTTAVQWDEVEFFLHTPRGRARSVFQLPPSQGRPSILYIGDAQGTMVFLRNEPDNERYRYQIRAADAYAKPGELPDRVIGYSGVRAVVLGQGAERMRDSEIRALRMWVLSGGAIIFLGGASAAVLQDGRWAGLVPISNPRPATLRGPPRLPELADRGPWPFREVSLTVGDPAEGAEALREAGNPVIVSKFVGLGKVVYLAFDPFDGPLREWTGRRMFFLSCLGLDLPALHQDGVAALASGYMEGLGGPQHAPDPYYLPGHGYEEPAGPFSARLPSGWSVFLILFLYFLAVVPLNFLILRKLRMGERAWFTSPIISITFAAVFFASARGLYSEDLSRLVEGVLIVHPDFDEAYFSGHAQMFFPGGGRYDLGLSGVEAVTGEENIRPDYHYYGYYGDLKDSVPRWLNAVDVGEIMLAEMPVTNLAFREFGLRQRIPFGDWIASEIAISGDVASGKIENSSRYSLKEVTLYTPTRKFDLGDLDAANTLSFDGIQATEHVPGPRAKQQEEHYMRLARHLYVNRIAYDTGANVLIARVINPDFGPRIGKEVEGSTGVVILYFLKQEDVR